MEAAKHQTRSSCSAFTPNTMPATKSQGPVYLQPDNWGFPFLPDGKYHFLETQLPFQLYKENPMIKSEETPGVCCDQGFWKEWVGSQQARKLVHN